ncbi:PAS domain-containing protein [Marinibaculum pumilum]|uniref:PAS domain-containing protein n=1 Tax=Marinibaculum pumilum TaxID=1766165 RepID=A0ABV7LAT7_9PROT
MPRATLWQPGPGDGTLRRRGLARRRQPAAEGALDAFVATPFHADPAMASDPALGWLAALLATAADRGGLPRRSEITPRRIGPGALPKVLLLQVTGPPRRYLIRLVGTELVRSSGRDNTGRYFDELAEEQRGANPYYLQLLDHVADSGTALLVAANLFYRDRAWQPVRALVTPVSGNGDGVGYIACAIDLPPGEGQAAPGGAVS